MSNLLLQTKLFRPQPPNLVPRQRLLAQLNAGLNGKLTLVSAPAGFGKTTLIANWLSRLTNDDLRFTNEGALVNVGSRRATRKSKIVNPKSAWLSLDEKDNDADRFLTYSVAALQTAVSTLGQSILASRQTQPPPPLENALIMLVNELAQLNGRLLLTLDDYHLIHNDAIHQALGFLLDNAPPTFHLIMTTRADPPLPLPRWRVRGQLNEIRAADLRFTVEETAVFLNNLMELTLTPDQIQRLETRTEGWIAALQMAAISLRGRSDTDAFVAAFSGSHHFVLDYLTDEVLRGHPPEIRAFLLKTSILDQFCPELCDAMMSRGEEEQRSEGANAPVSPPHLRTSALLPTLATTNLFLIPLDDQRRWFRYHHLFAQFLQARLQRELLEAEIQALHSRASQWFDEQEMDEAAIDHALKAGDGKTAVFLIEKYTLAAMNKSELHKILGWNDAVAAANLPVSLEMAVWNAWARLFSGETDKLPAAMNGIAAHRPANQHEEQLRTGNIAALRGWQMMFQSDIPQAISLTQEALDTLPANSDHIRSFCYLNLGYIHLGHADLTAAAEAFSLSRDHAEKVGNLITAVFARTYLANVHRQSGDLFTAEREFRAAIDMALANGQQFSPAVHVASTALAGLLSEWNRLDEAEAMLTKGIALLEQTQNLALLAPAHATLVRLYVAKGDLPAAFAALDAADAIARDNEQATQQSMNDSLRAWLHLLSENYEWANQWAAKQTISPADSFAFDDYRTSLVLGTIWAKQKATAPQAIDLLANLVNVAKAQGFHGSQVQAQIFLAVAHEALGARKTAVSVLKTAVQWAEPQGYIRLFANVGQPVATLLQHLPQTPYVRQLLAAFPAQNLGQALTATPPSRPVSSLPDPLSPREHELLTLISNGLSNREIAQKLYITVSTTKRHLSNIYNKLAVSNRTQAVARARELGLLSD